MNRLTKIISLSFIGYFLFVSVKNPILAQNSQLETKPLEFQQAETFSFPDIGESPRGEYGSSRGGMIAPIGNIDPTAILPENKGGLTTAEYPTFGLILIRLLLTIIHKF